jgi:glutathione S-transferase
MITLYTFGPAFGLPDMSPFVMKVMVQLKMAGLAYEVNTRGMQKAPKGKLPYIVDGDEVVADSTMIRWHIERTRGIDLDSGLSPEQRGVAWAVEKLLEDHLYWLSLHNRWAEDANFEKGPKAYLSKLPFPLGLILPPLVRRKMLGYLQAQGTGRYSDAEREALVIKAVQSLADILGDKPYLTGYARSATDGTALAFVLAGLCPTFDGAIGREIGRHPNLLAYAERMRQCYFPETAPIVLGEPFAQAQAPAPDQAQAA